MSKLLKSIIVATVLCFIYLFPTIAHAACAENEIDVLGDGTQCELAKFTIITTEIGDDGKFQFYMSAKGTFYVDCGAGGTLSSSASDVSGMTITRSNTTGATYTCTYTGDTESKTIRFGGEVATGNAYVNGTNANAAAIRFNVTPTLVAGISGSLGAIFPSRGTTSAQQPRFYRTFYGCTNLVGTIPDNLFSGVTGTATYMFYQTFYNCSGLTGYIPAGMFDKITTYSSNMMTGTFQNSGLDTTCSGTTVQYITGFESYWNGKVSCTEPFVTPVVLDDQSATTGASPTTVYVKYGMGWYADSGATIPISALTTNPTKTDYDFDGYWTATNGAGTQVIDNDGNFLTTDAILKMAKITDASKTIYANWTQDYTVTYDCGDGTGTPPAGVTATSGKDFTPALSTGCYKDGYILSGWLVSNTTNNEIKTTGGTFVWNYNESKTFVAQYVESKFEIQTIRLDADDTVSFDMGARGTFYVDWGDGMTYKLSCSGGYASCGGTSGSYSGYAARTLCTVINTGTVYEKRMPHKYSKTGEYTVRFGGVATSYRDKTVCSNMIYEGYDAIRFNNWVKRVLPGGKLSALFPHLGTGQTKAVRFAGAFYNCSNLLSIPEDLFSGYTVPNTYMFNSTFRGCSGLTGSIPENLFAGISGAPATYMFSDTFSGCSGLTGSIPENLFSGISGAPAHSMFYFTFSGCSGLTGSIPENLFSGISGAPAYGMFYSTFSGCSGLTGSIPNHLFGNLSGTLASNSYSFYATFSNCTNLSGYVPADLFSGLSYASTSHNNIMNNIFSNTGLARSCPPCHTQYITGFEEYWDGKVSCEVSLGENEHIYNDVCYQDCDAGFTRLKTSTGLEFPIFDAKPTTPALAFLFNGKQCYAPLESGDGGTASMNVNVGGQIYHVGTNE